MALDVSEAIKTGFGSLKTDVGQKLVGLFVLINAVNFGSSFMVGATSSTGLMVLGGVLAIVSSIVAVIATIGALRSFREGELRKDLFLSNLLKPVLRLLGANITTAIFSYMVALVFLLPAIVVLGMSGMMTSLSSIGASSAAGMGLGGFGIAGILLGLLGGIVGAVAFVYIAICLLLAQPLIAIEDKRMFQALDESIQRTKGNRLAIFATGLVIGIIYFAAILAGSLTGAISQGVGAAVTQLVVAPIFSVIFLSVLNHFSEELPLNPE